MNQVKNGKEPNTAVGRSNPPTNGAAPGSGGMNERMNPFGRGPPPTRLRERRQGGVGPGRPKTAPQADQAGTRPTHSPRAELAASSRGPGAPGAEPELPTRGPPTDDARAQASPRTHRARSRPRRRLRLLTRRRRRRARRGHANEPTVSAAPRRAGASCCRALVRRRRRPPPSPLAQARCSLLRADSPEAKG